MIFDELGLPKDQGATDFNDSARLAGIMVLFEHPEAHRINLMYYLNTYGFYNNYVRHPKESTYDFSRDQAVCLMSGYYARKMFEHVDEDFITGKDIYSPSVAGHFARCEGKKSNFIQNFWLKLDILWNAYVQPRVEPNQLICMCVVAGPEYVKMWTRNNKVWREAIRKYWDSWRGEPELAELMIKKLESYA